MAERLSCTVCASTFVFPDATDGSGGGDGAGDGSGEGPLLSALQPHVLPCCRHVVCLACLAFTLQGEVLGGTAAVPRLTEAAVQRVACSDPLAAGVAAMPCPVPGCPSVVTFAPAVPLASGDGPSMPSPSARAQPVKPGANRAVPAGAAGLVGVVAHLKDLPPFVPKPPRRLPAAKQIATPASLLAVQAFQGTPGAARADHSMVEFVLEDGMSVARRWLPPDPEEVSSHDLTPAERMLLTDCLGYLRGACAVDKPAEGTPAGESPEGGHGTLIGVG
jgi:hypothetical protein